MDITSNPAFDHVLITSNTWIERSSDVPVRFTTPVISSSTPFQWREDSVIQGTRNSGRGTTQIVIWSAILSATLLANSGDTQSLILNNFLITVLFVSPPLTIFWMQWCRWFLATLACGSQPQDIWLWRNLLTRSLCSERHRTRKLIPTCQKRPYSSFQHVDGR